MRSGSTAGVGVIMNSSSSASVGSGRPVITAVHTTAVHAAVGNPNARSGISSCRRSPVAREQQQEQQQQQQEEEEEQQQQQQQQQEEQQQQQEEEDEEEAEEEDEEEEEEEEEEDEDEEEEEEEVLQSVNMQGALHSVGRDVKRKRCEHDQHSSPRVNPRPQRASAAAATKKFQIQQEDNLQIRLQLKRQQWAHSTSAHSTSATLE
jgi:hypothetical protein